MATLFVARTRYRRLRKLPKIAFQMRYCSSAFLFTDLPRGASDPIQELNKRLAADPSDDKIDLGAGVYWNQDGQYHLLDVIRKAKKELERRDFGHDYNPTIGISSFREHAQRLVFGSDHPAVQQNRIATIQTVAGTGANRIGAASLGRSFAARQDEHRLTAYIGTPGWVNYPPLFSNAGIDVKTFLHLGPGTSVIDFEAIQEAMASAPEPGIFVLQAVCHNPTGIDYTPDQWRGLARLFKKHRHLAFFDAAYLGFGTASRHSIDVDAWPIRHFADEGVHMLVAQSFSKNMGLYSERVGALHLVCQDATVAERVLDQLRQQLRWEVSSSPAYGAHLADIVMGDKDLMRHWAGELQTAVTRMEESRKRLHSLMSEKFKTPGDWDFILNSKGLFALCDLSTEQVERMINTHHVYLPPSGRINVAGLNEDNVERVARALDEVTRRKGM